MQITTVVDTNSYFFSFPQNGVELSMYMTLYTYTDTSPELSVFFGDKIWSVDAYV